MLHIWDLERHLKVLSAATPADLIQTDVEQLGKLWFGSNCCPPSEGGILLELGGGSGLHALHVAQANPSSRIMVVEPDAVLHRCLLDTFQRSGFGNVTAWRTLQEALARLNEGRPRIEVLKVSLPHAHWPILQKLFQDTDVDHLAGEFDASLISPIALFRASRRHAQSFFWRRYQEGSFFSGTRSEPIEVSLIVPAYGVAGHLPQCLESLIGQTLESKEIIVVDDGSLDATGTIADEWASKYPNTIRVIHKENGGCASARNAGLRAARGEFVAFVDADDWCDLSMFEELYAAAATRNAEIAQCGFRRAIEEDGSTEEQRELDPTALRDGEGLMPHPFHLLHSQPSIWRRIYRRDFLLGKKIFFAEHIRRYDDLPFQFESLCQASRITVIPEAYYNWRVGRAGQDISITDQRLFVHFDLFEYLRQRVNWWADFELERHLVHVEIKSHMWAVSRLERKYRRAYLRAAALQFYSRRNTMSRPYVLRDAFGVSMERGVFAIRCFVLFLMLRSVQKLRLSMSPRSQAA